MAEGIPTEVPNLQTSTQSPSPKTLAILKVRAAKLRFEAKEELALKELRHWNTMVNILQSAILDCKKHEEEITNGVLGG